MEILLSCTTISSPCLFFSGVLLLIPALLLTLVLRKMKRKGSSRAGDKSSPVITHPPGPNFISTIKIIFNIRFFGLPHLFLGEFSKEYGSIMLLHLGRLPTLVISSAETAKEILKTHDLNFCTRPQLAGPKRITNNFIDVAVAPYGDYWREMRKIYVHKIMSAKCVQSFSSVREEEVSNMINSIISSTSSSTTATTRVTVDFHDKLLSLSASIFFRVIFGTSHQVTKTMDGCLFEQVVSKVTETLGRLSAADLVPYIGWMIDVISGQHATLEKDYHALYTFLEQFISEYLDPSRAREPNKMNEAVIDILFELEGKEIGGVTLTREHVKTVLADIFGAGIDTSYVSIVWAMAEIVKNPRIMKNVQDEVRNCVGKKGKVSESDLDQLQYLKMVVKETLRLHPPGPLLIPRECIKQCNIKDYDICPKTIVVVNVWAIGRDPDFWDNPNMFSPERFMDNTIDFMGQNFEFLPFGAGRRGCPGIYLATAIMELTLANLLYCFNWELPNGMKKEDLNMEEAGTLFLHKKSGLELVLDVYNP